MEAGNKNTSIKEAIAILKKRNSALINKVDNIEEKERSKEELKTLH